MEYGQYPQQQNLQQTATTTTANYSNIGTGPETTSPTTVSSQQQQNQGTGHNMYQPQYGGVPQQGMQQVHYGMPGIQAAAMAATAAASGSNYPYMNSDPNMPQSSPRMGANSKKDARSSPRMNNLPQIPGRRMSQVTSPGVSSAPNLLNHTAARPGVSAPQMPQAQMQHPQSPEMPSSSGVEESPLYVNAKQFHRILKRRVARQRLEEQLRLTSKGRKPYLHESRHNHAMRRPRGPGGRFLTAEEVAAMEREKEVAAEAKAESAEAAGKMSGGAGTKRKSEAGSAAVANKKAKTETESPDDDDDEDDG